MTIIYIDHLTTATYHVRKSQAKKNDSGDSPETMTGVAPCPVLGGHNPRNLITGRPGLPGPVGGLFCQRSPGLWRYFLP